MQIAVAAVAAWPRLPRGGLAVLFPLGLFVLWFVSARLG